MLPVLLIEGGLALACAWFLWDVVDSYGDDRHKARNDRYLAFAMVAAGGNVGLTVALLRNALPDDPRLGLPLAVLAGSVSVCAACLVVTAFSADDPRHRDRNHRLLTTAAFAASLGVLVVLLLMMTVPAVREAVGAVVDSVVELVRIVLTVAVGLLVLAGVIGLFVLLDDGDDNAPRRPEWMSRKEWNRQQRMLRRYRERNRGHGETGSGYDGGSRGDSGFGGDGGGGDGGD